MNTTMLKQQLKIVSNLNGFARSSIEDDLERLLNETNECRADMHEPEEQNIIAFERNVTPKTVEYFRLRIFEKLREVKHSIALLTHWAIANKLVKNKFLLEEENRR